MLRPSLLCIITVLSIQVESAPDCDLKSIFRTPSRRNYDQLEILERSNFDQDDQATPTTTSNVENPKSFANAQVLLRFGGGVRDEGRKCACGDLCTCRCPPPLQPYCYPGYLPQHYPHAQPLAIPQPQAQPQPQSLILPHPQPPCQHLSRPSPLPIPQPLLQPQLSCQPLPHPPPLPLSQPQLSCQPLPHPPPLPLPHPLPQPQLSCQPLPHPPLLPLPHPLPHPQCYCLPQYQIPPYVPNCPYHSPVYSLPRSETFPIEPTQLPLEVEKQPINNNVAVQDNFQSNQVNVVQNTNVVNEAPQVVSNNVVQQNVVNEAPQTLNNNIIQQNVANEVPQIKNNHPQILGPVTFPENAIDIASSPTLALTNDQIEEDIQQLEEIPRPEIVNKIEPSVISPNVKFINIDIDRKLDKNDLDHSLLPYVSVNQGNVEKNLLVTYPIFRRPQDGVVLPEPTEIVNAGYRISSASGYYADPGKTVIYRKPTVLSILCPQNLTPRPPQQQKQYYVCFPLNSLKVPPRPHPVDCACYGCAKYLGELNERSL